MKQTEILTRVTHVNGWEPAVYIHELHESKFPFVSRIEFIRSKLSNFSAHVYGVTDISHYQLTQPRQVTDRKVKGDGKTTKTRPS